MPSRQAVAAAHADDQGPAEGDDAGGREVDAGLHDDEHLPERRNGENRHVGKDVRPRRMLERIGRDDRGDDDEYSGGDPDREEARRDDGARDERTTAGGQRTVLSGQDDGEGHAAARRPFCAGAASSVNPS